MVAVPRQLHGGIHFTVCRPSSGDQRPVELMMMVVVMMVMMMVMMMTMTMTLQSAGLDCLQFTHKVTG